MIFAYPSDYYTKSRPHEMYAYEHACAIGAGFDTLIFDDDAMRISRLPYKEKKFASPVVWRGWQMTDEKYNQFYAVLKEKGFTPVTTPRAYMMAHSAENYFGYIPPRHSIGGFTLPYPDCLDVSLIRENALKITTTPNDHRLFVKDYVKSVRKHECIDIDDPDEKILAELEAIIAGRGDDFAGGLAFKDWRENLQDETRFVLVNEKVVVTGPHGSGPRTNERFPSLELPLVVNPPNLFYTVDVAWCPDVQEWMVVEVGDGQVSELPKGTVEEFYNSFRWQEVETKVRARREIELKEEAKRRRNGF